MLGDDGRVVFFQLGKRRSVVTLVVENRQRSMLSFGMEKQGGYMAGSGIIYI